MSRSDSALSKVLKKTKSRQTSDVNRPASAVINSVEDSMMCLEIEMWRRVIWLTQIVRRLHETAL